MYNDILTIGSVSSADYGIYVMDVNDTDMPRRDYSVVSVPGRSRDLHYDNGRYENIDRTYTCYVADTGSYGRARDVIATFVGRIMRLKGYQRIECSLHPDHYKKGEFRGEVVPEYASGKDAAVVQLTFDCDARKYLFEGEREITLASGSQTVFNPGTQDAYPVFTLTRDGTITIGGRIITVEDNPGTLVIDCELGDAYEKTAHTNYNQHVSFSDHDLFTLPPGNTNIAVSGFSTRKLTPRWVTL